MFFPPPTFTVMSFHQNLIFKIVYSNFLVLRCHYCTSCSCFSHRYGYQHTLFLCICYLIIAHSTFFSCHLSFIFSDIMPFISPLALRNSLLWLIAACNIADFVLQQFVLVDIPCCPHIPSVSQLLVCKLLLTVLALFLCFMGKYKRYMSAFG